MLNKTILMSGAEYFAADAPINPYYGAAIDVEAARIEHAAIRATFMRAGINVIKVPPPQGCQDGVYTANWGLCRGSTFVLACLPGARKAEEEYATELLAQLGKTVLRVPDNGGLDRLEPSSLRFSDQGDALSCGNGSSVSSPLRFSGQGDALRCGPYLLAGCGYRSDAAAQSYAADVLGLELVQLHALPELDGTGQPRLNSASGWPESRFYDIDLAIGVLRDDLIAWCPQAFDEQSRERIERLPVGKIIVAYDEAVEGFACNLVSTGSTVIISDRVPRLVREIERHGLKVIQLNTTELSKGGGGIRCVSLTLD
ncbi:MAG: hypothetical protein FWD43_03850 [Coriobacteriia bacterium]|nr:hypothetical protein [Coriobacteriia bacterium]